MSQNKNISEIINNNFFAGITDLQKKVPFGAKNFAGIPEGEIIFQNGDESNFVYLIVEGEIKLKFSNPNGSSVIITKGKNEFFGERELLEGSARQSAAVANTDCIVYKLSKKDINRLLKKDPNIKKNILRQGMQLGEDDADVTEEAFQIDETSGDNPDEVSLPETEADDIEGTNESIEEHAEDADGGEIETAENIEEPAEEEVHAPDEDILDSEEKHEDEPAAGKDITDELILDDDEGYLQWEINEEVPSADEPIDTGEIEDEKIKEAAPLDEEINEEETGVEESLNIESAEEHEDSAERAEEIQTTGPEPESTEDENLKEKSPETAGEITTSQLIKSASRIAEGADGYEICLAAEEEIISLTDAGKVVLYIADNENKLLVNYSMNGENGEKIKLKFGEGLAGDCAAMKSVINLKDAESDTRFNPSFDKPDGINTKSMLCMPVIGDDGELSGIIQLFNSGKGSFSGEDENLVKEISEAAAAAVSKLKASEKNGADKSSELLIKLAYFLINDINNPLLTIKHYADFIKRKETDEDIKKVSEIISDQAAAAYDLLQSTLNYAEGLESLKKETAKISDILDVALEMLAEYAESRNVKLFKKYDTEQKVEADRKSLYQACYQIVKNACDALPEGGEIYVSVEADGDNVSLGFTDTGAGLLPELGDIFKPFYSKGKGKSAGLGLAIAEKIISLHGGKITAGNDPEKGAVFTIFLPAAE